MEEPRTYTFKCSVFGLTFPELCASAASWSLDAVFLFQLIRAWILFVSGNWSNVVVRSTDIFPSLHVNEAGNGSERSGPGLAFLPQGPEL